MPTMETRVADTGKLVLLGDAAHALPPTGAQGAGVAIEDAYGLGLALGDATTETETDISGILARRQQRVKQVADFASEAGKSRIAMASAGSVVSHLGNQQWL
jgi:2-polyprenyl-6-methoxyphenol hydroxylase-like FAD-dependent oxidoreductase